MGDDVLVGGAGADQLDGGLGADVASYREADAGVTVDLTLAAQAAGSGEASGDALTSVEHLIGSAHDDTLTGDDGDNVLLGGAGADRIDGGAGRDAASYRLSEAGVVVDLSLAAQAGAGDEAGDVLTGIETLIGSDHAIPGTVYLIPRRLPAQVCR